MFCQRRGKTVFRKAKGIQTIQLFTTLKENIKFILKLTSKKLYLILADPNAVKPTSQDYSRIFLKHWSLTGN